MTLTGCSGQGGTLTVAFDPYELALLGDALKNGNTETEPLGGCQWRHTAAGFFLMASLAARLADEARADLIHDFDLDGTGPRLPAMLVVDLRPDRFISQLPTEYPGAIQLC